MLVGRIELAAGTDRKIVLEIGECVASGCEADDTARGDYTVHFFSNEVWLGREADHGG